MKKIVDINSCRDTIGHWSDPAFEKVFGSEASFSHFDKFMRHYFLLAWEGDVAAIRTILRAYKANIRARDEQKRWDWYEVRPKKKIPSLNPSNADAALLLMDICAADNDTLTQVGSPDSPGYETAIKKLQPNRIAYWAADFARERAQFPQADEYLRHQTVSHTSSDDSRDVALWYSQRWHWIAEIVRLRGPGATQFQPGQSGNKNGRPRKRAPTLYPYDDFFMVPMTVPVNGKSKTMTRLDALMWKLVVMAQNGEKKILEFITPHLMDIYEEHWFTPTSAEIIREGTSPSSIYDLLRVLGIISSRAKKAIRLKPFIIEAALAKLDRRFTRNEQQIIMRAVAKGDEVNWPDWWEAVR